MSSSGSKQQQQQQSKLVSPTSSDNVKEQAGNHSNNTNKTSNTSNSNTSSNKQQQATKDLASNNNNNNNNNKQQFSKSNSEASGQTKASKNNSNNSTNNKTNPTPIQTRGRSGKSSSTAKKSHQKQSSLALHRSQLQEKLKTNNPQQTNHNNKLNNIAKNLANNQNSAQLQDNPENSCSTLDEYSKRAQDIKTSIQIALEKQKAKGESDSSKKYDNQLIKLKEDIHKLSGIEEPAIDDKPESVIDLHPNIDSDSRMPSANLKEGKSVDTLVEAKQIQSEDAISSQDSKCLESPDQNHPIAQSNDEQSKTDIDSSVTNDTQSQFSGCEIIDGVNKKELLSQTNLNSSPVQELTTSDKVDDESKQIPVTIAKEHLEKLSPEKPVPQKTSAPPNGGKSTNSNNKQQKEYINKKKNIKASPITASSNQDTTKATNDLATESAASNKFDTETKVSALLLSLQNIKEDPSLLESVCKKLVTLSEQNAQLLLSCTKLKSDNQKLQMVKQKLESLCRELQKSNNAIRIESLDLIKGEQNKAREQTTKVQSTLTGVIKLFDENQQRNMLLRQENQDLQIKLKSLLDHCDNWEKSVEATLRQRDIENRLIKTELAKANLSKNEEKEKLLSEKQELLQILSMMQEQQQRIEGQEAKLRSDLSSYASKYDECQAVISKGMNRFQIESKKMLKQIEQSKQDYKILLSKYESSDKRMAQLLTEKQKWDQEMFTANKKIETLEKLCRALQDRKVSEAVVAEDNIEKDYCELCNGEIEDADAGCPKGCIISEDFYDDDIVNCHYSAMGRIPPGQE